VRFLLVLPLILLSAICWRPTWGQSEPLKGVVWQMPALAWQAEADLIRMKSAGVEAVRTQDLPPNRLLTLADTLGIHFFYDLPLVDLPARRLLDTLDRALGMLDLAISSALVHPSLRHFGLAIHGDTSDPASCRYFDALSSRVRERAPEGSRSYYETRFVEADVCFPAVDFVLLVAVDEPSPGGLLARWHQSAPSRGPAGIGSLGTWVRSDTLRGLRVPRSEEAQARYLETHLNDALRPSPAASPIAVFVYRWRDVVASAPSPALDLRAAYLRPYGLLAESGVPRLSYSVLEGIYTGRQTVFAFPSGQPAADRNSWAILLGWAVIVLLGLFYSFSPRFRHMVPRYFRAHGFYRDAVREGRDLLFGASSVLLTAICIGAAMVVAALIEAVRHHQAFLHLFGLIPETFQRAFVALVSQPTLLVLLAGSLYALGILVWSSLLAFAVRRRYPLLPGQAVMLVVWPRWPNLVLMAAVMVLSTQPHEVLAQGAPWLALCFLVVTVFSVARTLYDYSGVTRAHLPMLSVLALANPILLVLLLAALLAVNHLPELTYAWHLATRT
jgi:hypothetical protein